MELALYHPFGAWDFEVVSWSLENLCIRAVRDNFFLFQTVFEMETQIPIQVLVRTLNKKPGIQDTNFQVLKAQLEAIAIATATTTTTNTTNAASTTATTNTVTNTATATTTTTTTATTTAATTATDCYYYC